MCDLYIIDKHVKPIYMLECLKSGIFIRIKFIDFSNGNDVF